MAKVDRNIYLGLETVINYLRGQSGLLYADIQLAERCQGFLFVKQGRPLDCVIENQRGQLLSQGEGAYAQLKHHREWHISVLSENQLSMAYEQHRARHEQLTSEQSMRPYRTINLGSSSPGVSLADPPLRQIAQLHQFQLEGLTMRQRLVIKTVLAMVNGERSARQVKALLSLPHAAIDEALESLHFIQVIEE